MKTVNEVCQSLNVPVYSITYILHKSGEVLTSGIATTEDPKPTFAYWSVFKIAYDYETCKLTLTVFPF